MQVAQMSKAPARVTVSPTKDSTSTQGKPDTVPQVAKTESREEGILRETNQVESLA